MQSDVAPIVERYNPDSKPNAPIEMERQQPVKGLASLANRQYDRHKSYEVIQPRHKSITQAVVEEAPAPNYHSQ